jgi:UDP-N-acetylglucosamine--N-acetylmuramyl-(pentapeptide) pyrophosphoryl-undecaprenol N-acetylglucosamine transferase
MELAYAAADLAVCRAGAMTCGELAAVGLPAVFVPLPVGNGEQRLNALPIVDAGGGVLLDDSELSAERLTEVVLPLLGDAPRLADMGRVSYALGARDGDRIVAEQVLDVIGGRTMRREGR